jgi:hypothetical protein
VEISEGVLSEIQKQAEELLTNDSLRAAYNNFMLLSKLSNEGKD